MVRVRRSLKGASRAQRIRRARPLLPTYPPFRWELGEHQSAIAKNKTDVLRELMRLDYDRRAA